MRVLLDTNVLVSAFVAGGQCEQVFEHCVERHAMVTCEHILGELLRVLNRLDPSGSAAQAAHAVRITCQLVEPAVVPATACRDPGDLAVLGAAVAGRCDCLVTGDRDLLVLGKYEGIPIVSPVEFWRLDAGRNR